MAEELGRNDDQRTVRMFPPFEEGVDYRPFGRLLFNNPYPYKPFRFKKPTSWRAYLVSSDPYGHAGMPDELNFDYFEFANALQAQKDQLADFMWRIHDMNRDVRGLKKEAEAASFLDKELFAEIDRYISDARGEIRPVLMKFFKNAETPADRWVISDLIDFSLEARNAIEVFETLEFAARYRIAQIRRFIDEVKDFPVSLTEEREVA